MKRLLICLLIAASLAGAWRPAVAATTGLPEIGVFFDPDATTLSAILGGGFTDLFDAWICIRRLDDGIAAAAFRLDIPPLLFILEALPGDFQQTGSLTAGIVVAFAEPFPIMQDVLALYRLRCTTFENVFIELALSIVAHPDMATPTITTADARILIAEGLTSTVYPAGMPSESLSWGAVRTLYR